MADHKVCCLYLQSFKLAEVIFLMRRSFFIWRCNLISICTIYDITHPYKSDQCVRHTDSRHDMCSSSWLESHKNGSTGCHTALSILLQSLCLPRRRAGGLQYITVLTLWEPVNSWTTCLEVQHIKRREKLNAITIRNLTQENHKSLIYRMFNEFNQIKI